MAPNTPSDHDLLIRIDEKVSTISSTYIDVDQLNAKVDKEIVTHERKMHKGVSWALIGQILVALLVALYALYKTIG